MCTIRVLLSFDFIVVHSKLRQVVETMFSNHDMTEVLTLPNRLVCVVVPAVIHTLAQLYTWYILHPKPDFA